MKVLLVHNFYQSSAPSGEDRVFRDEVALLRKNSIEVVLYEQANDAIKNRLEAALSVIWSRKTYHEIAALIKKEKPDIAHFHNIWYLISPSAYYACKDAGVPIVQTLHNFRMFCANGLLLRNEKPCEECVGKVPWRGLLHGCYRDSRFFTAPVVFAEWFHLMRDTWQTAVDAYITLTEFGKKKFIQCGLPEKKIFVKPNFLSDPPNFLSPPQQYVVFIGRLSKEKGVNILIDALKHLNTFTLKLIGDGPLRPELEKQIEDKKLGEKIEFTGRMRRAECMELLKRSCCLIMPSVCYENFPMAIVEAFACGKPVVASRLGVMADIIEDKKTGLLFNPGDPLDLAEKIGWMVENKEAAGDMGRNARTEFENKYTADRNFDTLIDIYKKTLTANILRSS